MTECPKCGNTQNNIMHGIGGPIYDKKRNRLIYICGRCGYEQERLPLDVEGGRHADKEEEARRCHVIARRFVQRHKQLLREGR